MLRLDSRTGSGELEKLFKPYGIQPLLCRLDFGDMDWIGNGPSGECAVVVERKRIDDLIQSMQSKRLSGHQLPGMAEQYDYCYLIVEGIWKCGDDGNLLVSNGGWHKRGIAYRAVTSYLSTLQLKAGVNVWRSVNEYETVSYVIDQYRWWTQKRWAEHQAHEAVYAPADPTVGRRLTFRPREISLLEKMSMQLPGVDKKAREVAESFKSVQQMANADVERWIKIKGIGKTGAERIVEAIRRKV